MGWPWLSWPPGCCRHSCLRWSTLSWTWRPTSQCRPPSMTCLNILIGKLLFSTSNIVVPVQTPEEQADTRWQHPQVPRVLPDKARAVPREHVHTKPGDQKTKRSAGAANIITYKSHLIITWQGPAPNMARKGHRLSAITSSNNSSGESSPENNNYLRVSALFGNRWVIVQIYVDKVSQSTPKN